MIGVRTEESLFHEGDESYFLRVQTGANKN